MGTGGAAPAGAPSPRLASLGPGLSAASLFYGDPQPDAGKAPPSHDGGRWMGLPVWEGNGFRWRHLVASGTAGIALQWFGGWDAFLAAPPLMEQGLPQDKSPPQLSPWRLGVPLRLLCSALWCLSLLGGTLLACLPQPSRGLDGSGGAREDLEPSDAAGCHVYGGLGVLLRGVS